MKVLSIGHVLKFLHNDLIDQAGIDVFKVWALCKESHDLVGK